MPLYDYRCQRCGAFNAWIPMAAAHEAQPCPACRQPAPRVLALPHIRAGRADNRYKANAHNERSANEPKMVNHAGRSDQRKDRHGHRGHARRHTKGQFQSSNRP